MITKTDVFEDMAVALDSWTNAASKAVIAQPGDREWVDSEEPYNELQKALERGGVDVTTVKQVFSECLRGFAISLLTIIDGGAASAEKGRIYLMDEHGRKLGEGLHDEFAAYLIKTGRLT